MPPIRNNGRSFKENLPGQYIYDPMFCIHGDDEEEEEKTTFIQLPFQSYVDISDQKIPNKGKVCHDYSGKIISTMDDKSKSRLQKTPRTMMKMMERHRENERVRHHTLNNSMKKVCERVPGSSPFMKETKVVMMQRIIAYICYLENTINCVCTHLGIRQLRMSTNFVTEQWAVPEKKKDEMIVIKRKMEPKQNKKSIMENRRPKISSPTIDSTTDNFCQTVSMEIVNSQDSQGVSSTHRINEDIFMDDNACCVPEHYEESYLNEDFLPSSTKLDNFPDAFDLMSSPLGNLPNHKTIDSSNEYGIQGDNQDIEMCESPLRTISPECVLPTALSQTECVLPTALSQTECILSTALSQSSHTESTNYVITPTKYRRKRKQNTPQRSPFSNITNISPRKQTNKSPELEKKWMKTDSKFSKKCPVDEDFVSYVPYIWKFHKSSVSRRKKIDVENQIPINQQSTDMADSKVDKIDHRKTTWMNGFMMFSRLNRRSFIEANPGVHTSYISKMMGHAWRQMTSDDQSPYREKAKTYASTMKNLACEESSDNDN